jgi:hypothetical protein
MAIMRSRLSERSEFLSRRIACSRSKRARTSHDPARLQRGSVSRRVEVPLAPSVPWRQTSESLRISFRTIALSERTQRTQNGHDADRVYRASNRDDKRSRRSCRRECSNERTRVAVRSGPFNVNNGSRNDVPVGALTTNLKDCSISRGLGNTDYGIRFRIENLYVVNRSR